MIALMELAAAKLLRACQASGELSVGVTVDVTHSAATPVGVEVEATARYTGREGKLFVFEVVAFDRGGEIGRGVHKRAIILRDRLLSGAARRNPPR
jgi:predicted thioesterase